MGLARSCQARTSTSLSVYCHSGIPKRLNRWGLPLRRDRDFDGLVDELQLLGFQALSESIGVCRLTTTVCHSCCSRAASVESPQCSVDTCVEDETVNSSGASAVWNLILFSAWCISLRVCHLAISGSLRRRCLQLAVLFHPLWIRSFPLWLLYSACCWHCSSQSFSPAVDPLFSLARSPIASF